MGETTGLNRRRIHFLKVRAVSLQSPSATQTPERLLARPGSFFKPQTADNNGAVSQASRSIIYMEFRLPMRIPAVGAFGAILKTAAQGPTPRPPLTPRPRPTPAPRPCCPQLEKNQSLITDRSNVSSFGQKFSLPSSQAPAQYPGY